MKKTFLLLVVLLVVFISGCEVKPKDKCYEDWDYYMVEKNFVAISYTTYWIETDDGDVQVAKKIYQNAQNGDYKEICITVYPTEKPTFKGAILLDGTPLDNNIVEELQEQLITEEDEE